MGDSNINITSSLLEKGVETIKGFLERIGGGTVDELGLMWQDNMKLRRFNNQIRILGKAQKTIAASGINIKQISLKSLVPLLEYSSLEEDETLQEKWSNLWVSFVDKESKYESTIFPFILNQLSSNEVKELDALYNYKTSTGPHQSGLSNAELSNLIRLGLVEKRLPEARLEPKSFFNRQRDRVEFSKEIGINITGLGKEFVQCCSTKV